MIEKDIEGRIEDLAHAVGESFFSDVERNREDDPANVVDGLFAIARALQAVAKAIDRQELKEALADIAHEIRTQV